MRAVGFLRGHPWKFAAALTGATGLDIADPQQRPRLALGHRRGREPFYGENRRTVQDRFASLRQALADIEREIGAQSRAVPQPVNLAPLAVPTIVEAGGMRISIDPATGDLLRIVSADGALALDGRSGEIVIERQPPHDFHQDFLAPPATRTIAARIDPGSVRVQARQSPETVIIASEATMNGGAVHVTRSFSISRQTQRIDVDLSVRGVPEDTIAYAVFRLPEAPARELRGLPYGYADRDLSEPLPYIPRYAMADHRMPGVHAAIAPAVRWSAHLTRTGQGIALLDAGSPGREMHQNEVRLMLMAASTHYRGLPNAWLDGAPEQRFRFALLPVFSPNPGELARAGHAYNLPVPQEDSPVQASENFVIESVRRYGRWLEVRGVEVEGQAGELRLSTSFQHDRAEFSDALGGVHGRVQPAARQGAQTAYRLPLRPQEIVTLRFRVRENVGDPAPLATYRSLYPPHAERDMRLRDPALIGHPPS